MRNTNLRPLVVFSQALCLVDHLYIEWHNRFFSRNVAKTNAQVLAASGRNGADTLVRMLMAVQNAAMAVIQKHQCLTVIRQS